MSLSDADLNRIAYTMLGEARPNDPAGMAAVGNVIMNRYAAGGWYGSTIEKITRPSQFATWAPKDQGGNDPVGRFSTSSAAFQRAKALAQQLANGEIPDNTGGALSYRAASAGTNFAGGKPTINIGGNVFVPLHPVSAGTQLIAQVPDASSLDAYASTYGWNNLPDADPQTGAPVMTASAGTPTQPAAPSSPSDALDAIAQATGQTLAGTPIDALGYADGGVTSLPSAPAPVPLAPLPDQAPPAATSQAPFPLPPPATVSGDQANQIALNSIKEWLKGSNVDLSKVPADKQVALLKAIPTLVADQNDPKAELNYLQSNGLMDALTAAVPSAPPGMGERLWAAANGVTLPALLPSAISTWNLPTGSDANAAVGVIQNALAQAQGTRVPSYAPDTGSPLGGPATAPAAPSPAAPASSNYFTQVGGSSIPSYQLDRSAPYGEGGITTTVADAGNGGWDAYTNPQAEGNTPQYWSGAQQQGGGQSSGNSLSSWADPYYGAVSSQDQGQQDQSNSSWAQPYYDSANYQDAMPAADLASLEVAKSVDVPQFITVSHQIQVPADQPIEKGSSGVVWNPKTMSYELQDTPAPAAPAAPKMITKTITKQVPNPAYHAPAAAPAPAPAPAQPTTVTSTNGYVYQQNADGSYTHVGVAPQYANMTPAQQYAAKTGQNYTNPASIWGPSSGGGGGGGNNSSGGSIAGGDGT